MSGPVPTDMTGYQYGDFTVLKYTGESRWFVRCKCGATNIVRGATIRDGTTRRICNHNREICMSEREAEVARLVAQGLPSKAIAERLIVSPKTVQTHLSNIFGKFGLSNRTELALMMVQMEKST
jgi:DNA-binding NarL/FixJ family response regulator